MRCRLDVRKFAFSNRIVDKWNSLSDSCVKCATINNSKCHTSKELEPEINNKYYDATE